jgi:regulator of protease activity HflC (stomatin/prohibitin superfamily)
MNGPLAQSVRLAFRLLSLVVLLMAVGWFASNIRQVPADSQAVVERFGRVDRVSNSGLVLAWPQPIERVLLLPARDRQTALPVEVLSNNGPTLETSYQIHQADDVVELRPHKDAWNGQYFLTGDGSVVRFDATLFYRITDPAAYVQSQEHVAPALQRLFRASLVSLAAVHDLDDFLVARPEEEGGSEGVAARRLALRADLVAAINARLADLQAQGSGLGVELGRIDIVAQLPPLVKRAYDSVLTATQIADQTEAAARTDAARTAQDASRANDSTISEAQAAGEEQVRQASSDTAAVIALQAQLTPHTRENVLMRYYRQQIGLILHKIGQVTTVDASAGQHVILPGPP